MPSRATEFTNCRVVGPAQVLLPDISYVSFVYPGDEEALATLKRVPGASPILVYLQKHLTEELSFLESNQQMIRATSTSYGTLYRLLERCCSILSCPVPDLYITQNPLMNAETSGHRHTHLVLHSALIEGMTADELSFVIGHELGHIKCGHGLYRQLGSLLIEYWQIAIGQIPVPGLELLRIPLMLAYWEWFRRAELTCDRAGLLCLQSIEPALMALAKLAGRVEGFEEELDVESTILQADSHQSVSKLARAISILSVLENTHPFVPDRLKQLKAYSASSEYQAILRGQYIHDPLGIHEGGPRIDCSRCRKEFNAKLAFCPYCGMRASTGAKDSTEPTAVTCHNCRFVLGPTMSFCTRCGVKQAGAY